MHLIGHLQTNKAGRAVDVYDLIHSVDSARLAEAIDRRAGAVRKRQDVLVEVNTTGEPGKYGVAPEDVERLAEAIAGLDNLRLRGLMTIGPLEGGERGARRSFRALRDLRARVARVTGDPAAAEILSMGMSGDFEFAIEEGATHVRVGTAIFGPRDVPVARTPDRSGA
jgi:pyridoxal phosphate enzyme (YggS family)